MTHIVELGAVDDVFEVIENHQRDLFAVKSSLDLLSNLMHNSNQNRVLICAKADRILTVLTTFGSKDSGLAQKALRSLGNLAYVPENVQKLVKAGNRVVDNIYSVYDIDTVYFAVKSVSNRHHHVDSGLRKGQWRGPGSAFNGHGRPWKPGERCTSC